MVIFGIDPGSNITGYGVIRVNGSRTTWIDSGTVRTPTHSELGERLVVIYDGLSRLLQYHRPDWVCIEEAFYAKNVHTTLVLGHARGVAMLAARKWCTNVAEYAPRAIKQAVVGKGGATKEQVSYMIRMLLSPPKDHDQVDACDALAVALCGSGDIFARQALERAR